MAVCTVKKNGLLHLLVYNKLLLFVIQGFMTKFTVSLINNSHVHESVDLNIQRQVVLVSFFFNFPM